MIWHQIPHHNFLSDTPTLVPLQTTILSGLLPDWDQMHVKKREQHRCHGTL